MSVNTGTFILDLIGNDISTKLFRCRKYKLSYPKLTPVISFLSTSTSQQGIYTEVFLNGLNFLPFGQTVLNFGSYKNIPISYLSSFNISFVVPIEAIAGNYQIQLANIVKTQVIPMYDYSNTVDYVIF